MQYMAFSLTLIFSYFVAVVIVLHDVEAEFSAKFIIGGSSFLVGGVFVALFLMRNRALIERFSVHPGVDLFVEFVVGKRKVKNGEKDA